MEKSKEEQRIEFEEHLQTLRHSLKERTEQILELTKQLETVSI